MYVVVSGEAAVNGVHVELCCLFINGLEPLFFLDRVRHDLHERWMELQLQLQLLLQR